MNQKFKISVNLPKSKDGFHGRECPECEEYFKVKGGTGLETDMSYCPYCNHYGNADTFFTKEQIEYARSIATQQAMNHINKVLHNTLNKSFKNLERAIRGSFIQIKVKSNYKPVRIPIKYYSENDVETNVTCDNCNLEFAIFGIFATCPDCGKLNAGLIFKKSIEAIKKRFIIYENAKEDKEIQEGILANILSSGVSSFDAMGKALQRKYQSILPRNIKNLFQKLSILSDIFLKSIGKSIPDIIGQNQYNFLYKMFQVRHIYEHNLGIIDDDFIKKIPALNRKKGRKYKLNKEEIEKFINLVLKLEEELLLILK